MTPLKSLQDQMTAFLQDRQQAEIANAIKSDWLEPQLRLNIYRNNFRLSLLEALKANFPVTVELLDVSFFEPVALNYIEHFPPTQPSLFVYGVDFASYLKNLPILEAYPFVAEMAAFEYCVNKVSHARFYPPPHALIPEEIQSFIAMPWSIQPLLAWMSASFDILTIWEAHKIQRQRLSGLKIEPGEYFFILYRAEDRLFYAPVNAGEYAFLENLAASASLDQAVEAGLVADASFDFQKLFGLLIGRQLVYPDEKNRNISS